MKRAVWSFLVVLAWSCGQPPPGTEDSGNPDASVEDAGRDADVDAGGTDDAGIPDAGAPDAGLPDAGAPDAGSPDSGTPDAGTPDAGLPDAGVRPDGGLCPLPSGVGAPFRVRAMAANLTSGNLQSYDPGHGARIMQGVDPDIVMIQEFNYGTNSASAIAGFVSATFDGGFSYQRGAGQIPNGVISRWPIVAQGEWTDTLVGNRGFTWAKVDLPGPNDLWVVSVHLLTSSAGNRNNEAGQLITRFNANIPAGDYLLLGGDFNTDNRSEAAFTTFSSRLVVAGPHPADQDGAQGTNRNRDKPYDNVLASPCLKALQTATVIGNSTYASGLVVDTTVYTPLSEIAPAQFGDSNASNMQHMGVVKDFLIQP
jgi:endonuclease/exonuclease/phosphatase family metal-dependent hydrolase